MSKNILMAVFGPIQTDARVIRSAKSLNSVGCKIDLISWNSVENYSSPYFNSINFKINKGIFNVLIFWFKVLWYIFKNRKKIDLVYCHDYFMAFPGRLSRTLFNKKWVYDAHELMLYKKNEKVSTREKIFSFLERISIKSASLVIEANYERMRVIKSVYKLENCTYVQNISDIENINELDINSPKDNIIVYQGILDDSRNVKFYVQMQEYLPKDYKLLLIGNGPSGEELKKEAEQRNIKENVIFAGRLTQAELYKRSVTSKIGIVTYTTEGLNNYFCAPNKIFEYASLGIPMIGTPQPFIKAIFKKYKVGEIVEWGDKETYINAIKKIIDNYDSYTKGLSQLLQDYNRANESKKQNDEVLKLIN